jgi:CRP-like cAMP-binding protein
MQDKLQQLQPVLKELQASSALPVIKRQQRLSFEKGESDFDTTKFFYFIMQGKIKISQINFETSKEQILYLLSAGDMFDVATLLDGQSNEYLIEVMEHSEVVAVPIEDIRQLLAKDPSFQRFFFPYIAKQLRSMEELAVDLSLYDVYQRIIHLFARYVDQNEKNPKLKIIENLSHEELASMVGSVRKVVNRALQKLKTDGIVDISRKQIKLLDLQKLLQKLEY